MGPTRIGHDPLAQRDLFCLELPSVGSPVDLAIPSPHFVCLLVADFSALSTQDVADLGDRLAGAGASYFLCWGPDCERAHDILDEVLHERNPDSTEDDVVMTTWHADESLADALFSFLRVSEPASDYATGTRAGVAIVVDDARRAAEVRQALAEPEGFVKKICEEES